MTSGSSNMPYIKTEPDEFGNNPNRYMQNGHNFSQNFSFGHNQQSNSIDPSELSLPGGNYGAQYPFGAQNMSSGYNMGTSGYQDDELLESLDINNNNFIDDYSMQNQPTNHSALQTNHQRQLQNVYSHTPEGPPIQSPFLGQFDYSQFGSMNNSLRQHMSPLQNPQLMANKRPSVQAQHRKSSDQRSPLTPHTATLHGLQIGTPESGNFPNGRPIRNGSVQNRHQKTLSGQFDATPSSLQTASYLESPLSSPPNGAQHAGISETLGSASLPAKVENTHGTTQSVEEKKKRRRASHNAVERRRRDNINERIQDLSRLVPMHRLEDDKVRKQLQSHGPLSPTLGATSMSPPNANDTATSLLVGPSGRRAASTAGNITLGLPVDDKEKGPNKGDILNGAVAWTRDLMWALHLKYQQEEELAQYISQLGGTWPFQITEDEKRMRTEVSDAIVKNKAEDFSYSRTDGSGLRVPKHTMVDGQRLTTSSTSPQSNFELSPGLHSGGSGTNSGSGQAQYWNSGGVNGISFKEEDEFMEDMA